MEGLPLALANGIGVVGVVLIVGWLLMIGKLHTDREVMNILRGHDQQIALLNQQLEDERHERSEWRTEARLNQQSVMELSEQNRAMLTAFGPTLTDFLRGLRRAGVGANSREGDA